MVNINVLKSQENSVSLLIFNKVDTLLKSGYWNGLTILKGSDIVHRDFKTINLKEYIVHKDCLVFTFD